MAYLIIIVLSLAFVVAVSESCTLDLSWKAFIHRKAGVSLRGKSGTWIRLYPRACIYTSTNNRGFGESGTSKLETKASISCSRIGALQSQDFKGLVDTTHFASVDNILGTRCLFKFDSRKGQFLEHRVRVTNSPGKSVVRITAEAQLGLPLANELPFGVGDLLAPDIKNVLTITLTQTSSATTSVSVEGTHKGFPFYEFIGNGRTVYRFEPVGVAFPVGDLTKAGVKLAQTRSFSRRTATISCKRSCTTPPPPPPPPPPSSGVQCSVSGRPGLCQNKFTTPCSSGAYFPGFCPGSAAIQCCSRVSCRSGSISGTCKDVNVSGSCSGGRFQSGLCPGPSNVRCCLRGGIQ